MMHVGGYLEYCWKCSVPCGHIMINVGGYLEYHGGVQYGGEYHEYCGSYHDARGGIS